MESVPREEFDTLLKKWYKIKTGKELREGVEIIDGKPVEAWYGIKLKDLEEFRRNIED